MKVLQLHEWTTKNFLNPTLNTKIAPQSKTRRLHRATSHAGPPPNRPPPLPHSLFPVHTVLNSSPKKADLSVLHDLICRIHPPLPGIHSHNNWLDLQECTKLPPVAKGQFSMRFI